MAVVFRRNSFGDLRDTSFLVKKVFDLLTKVQAKLPQDAADDQAIIDKMDCYCVTNRQKKRDSIATADKLIVHSQDAQASNAALAEGTQKRSRSEIKDQQSLRSKEAAFTKEEQDIVYYVKALEAAIEVFTEHQSFLQKPAADVKVIARTISHSGPIIQIFGFYSRFPTTSAQKDEAAAQQAYAKCR